MIAGALAVVVVAGTAAVAPPTVAAVAGGTVGMASTTPPTPAAARVGPPRSMSIIGDSISAGTGATGQASNIIDLIGQAGREQPENSWATGTAGGLDSVYQRLAAIQPAIEGRNDRRAVNGADMSNAPGQANAIPTGTEYVLIQMGGNDLCKSNESQMSSVSAYRSRFTSTLNNVWSRSPNALVYVASIPDIYNLWYLRGAPNPPNPNPSGRRGGLFGSLFFWSGAAGIAEFPCQSLLADADTGGGGAEARRLRVRQRNIELNQVLAEECAKYKYCRFDDFELFNVTSNRAWDGPGQAPSNAPLKPRGEFGFTDDDISFLDHFHPTLAGQRKLADMAWGTSFDFNDRTAPAISASVATSIGSDGKRRVDMSATDDAGIRAIEYRLHLPTGTSAWTSLLDADAAFTTVPVYTDQLAWVETRALDRNGNMSAGSLATVYPLPAAPSGPTFEQATQNGVEGMRVSWRAPVDENGTRGQVAPTVAYEVTASPGGQTCRTEAASLDPFDLANIETGCLVSGLTYGVNYSFAVRAITQGGPGTPATARLFTQTGNGPTSAIFLGPSAPVSGLRISPSGSDLVVSWSPPENLGGGDLLGYEVRSERRGSDGDPLVVSGCGTTVTFPPGKPPLTTYFTATQCTLRNVSSADDYDVEVRAITVLSSSTRLPKPILTSDPGLITGWLPDLPELASAPVATMSLATKSVAVSWPAIPLRQRPPGATVTVTAEPGGASCTVPADLTSCVITGLNYLAPYRFEVVVNNGAGTVSADLRVRLERGFEDAPPFADIPASLDYVINPARWLRANAVTTGVGGGNNFEPSGGVTREQMAAFLWRFAGEPPSTASCGFRDEAQISGYARPGACWLKSTGITTNNPYNPKGSVTREQMAAFLWRLAGQPASPASCSFADEAQIPGYARPGACWLKSTGITTNNPYKPKGAVTRGQMAAFLFRANNELNP